MNRNSSILSILFVTLIALNLISVRRLLVRSILDFAHTNNVSGLTLLDLIKERDDG